MVTVLRCQVAPRAGAAGPGPSAAVPGGVTEPVPLAAGSARSAAEPHVTAFRLPADDQVKSDNHGSWARTEYGPGDHRVGCSLLRLDPG
eukprot:745704-Hanusia_phi.AAC.1